MQTKIPTCDAFSCWIDFQWDRSFSLLALYGLDLLGLSPQKVAISCAILVISIPLVAQEFVLINQSESVVMQPKVSFDGSQLVFMANYDGRLKPYISTYDNDSARWAEPQLIFNESVNSKITFSHPTLNFDNNKLLISAKPLNQTHFDIYVSESYNGSWSEPIPLNIGINSKVDDLAPAVSSDGKRILFERPFAAEEKKEDYCKEIYEIRVDETGEWLPPELLAPSYNTGCLTSPYFARDNNTFYYASYEDLDGTDGKKLTRNQFNIYWAKNDGFLSFTPKPIYSVVADDHALSPSIGKDDKLYFALGDVLNSNVKRWESSVQAAEFENELRPGKMTLLTGKVTSEGQPIKSGVQIVNPFTSKVYQEVQCDIAGDYQVFLPLGQQFSVLAQLEGYSVQSKLVQTGEESIQSDFELFTSVSMQFNVFDEEFFFPITSEITIYDSAFQQLSTGSSKETITLGIGKELNIIFEAENYFPDTLNLPLDKEIIFEDFEFDIVLSRKIKSVDFAFTDGKTGNNLGLEITVYNVTRNEKAKRQVKDGKITLELRDGEVYEISTSAQGYSYFTSELDLSEEQQVEEVKAELQSVKDQAIVLNNITFELGSYNLNAQSYEELDKLVTYLMNNITYHVEIAAHTDDAGGNEFNKKLSDLRANSVMEYLQDHTITKDRLVANGFGEEQPIVPNDTEENKAKNRRVEFKIITDPQ